MSVPSYEYSLLKVIWLTFVDVSEDRDVQLAQAAIDNTQLSELEFAYVVQTL